MIRYITSVRTVIERLESEEFEEMNVDKEFSSIYHKLCGEYPGAVVVRQAYRKLGEMAELDHDLRRTMLERRNRKEMPPSMQSIKKDSGKLSNSATGTNNQPNSPIP